MRLSLKHAWPAGAGDLQSKTWRRLIDAGILLGLMLTATWLVRP
jgi:hypothetical protein